MAGPFKRRLGRRFMVLVGRRSNHDLATLLQRLTARDWMQACCTHPLVGGVAPDGRRPFGSIREAIVAVLEQAEFPLRVLEVHAAVERLPGEKVSRGSVKASLWGGSRRDGRCSSTAAGVAIG